MSEILKILIFIRPFISSLTFFWSNLFYSIITLGFLTLWFLRRRLSVQKIEPILHPLSLFVLALVISIVFSLNLTKSLSQVYNYLLYILIFLAVASLSAGEKKKLTRAIIFSGFIISLLALYQYFFGFKHLLDYMAKHDIFYAFGLDYVLRKRVFFPFVTPNTLGGFLILIIPLILGKRNLYPLLIPISLALFFTKSIGAFLSLFLGLTLYLYMMGKIERKKFIALAIIIIIIVLVFILRSQAPLAHLRPDFSLNRRFSYWQDSFKIIKAHPLMGVGLGNFSIILSRYAHNFLLQIWAELGILGFFGFIWFIISHFKYIFKNIKTYTDRSQVAGLLSASGSFLIHNFIDFTFFLPEVCFLWWVILGLSINRDE